MVPEAIFLVEHVGGHRQAYFDVISKERDVQLIELGAISFPSLLRVLFSRSRIIFGTCDDHVGKMSIMVFFRAIFGLKSTSILLRPQSCFEPGIKSGLKRILFLLLKGLPSHSTCTILPLWMDSRWSSVATGVAPDPQFWDCSDTNVEQIPSSNLSIEIERQAKGRKIVSFLGRADRDKSFSGFCQEVVRMLQTDVGCYFVVAGQIKPEYLKLLENIDRQSIFVVNRFVSDAELLSIYTISDAVWAKYSSSYDQASGIFGRAIQLGVKPVVRESSRIAEFAESHGVAAFYSIERCFESETPASVLDNQTIKSWKKQFFDSIFGSGQ